MPTPLSRRTFVKLGAAGVLAGTLPAGTRTANAATREYGISLAGWSLHRTIGTREGQVPMLDRFDPSLFLGEPLQLRLGVEVAF